MTCENPKCKIYQGGQQVPCTSVKLFRESCQGPWHIKERTGETSSNGSIYVIESEDRVINILKQVIYDYETTEDKMIREVDMQNIAVGIGIAPSILEVMYNDTGCSIIMVPLNATLDRIILDAISYLNEDSLIKRINQLVGIAIELIKRLHDANITHNDAHSNNFMLDSGGRMYLIDYGKARRGTNLEKYYGDCQRLVSAVLKRFDGGSRIHSKLQLELTKYTKPPKPKITKIVW